MFQVSVHKFKHTGFFSFNSRYSMLFFHIMENPEYYNRFHEHINVISPLIGLTRWKKETKLHLKKLFIMLKYWVLFYNSHHALQRRTLSSYEWSLIIEMTMNQTLTVIRQVLPWSNETELKTLTSFLSSTIKKQSADNMAGSVVHWSYTMMSKLPSKSRWHAWVNRSFTEIWKHTKTHAYINLTCMFCENMGTVMFYYKYM